MSSEIFSIRLRALMDGPPKISQETLAAHLGITRQAVSHYQSARSSPDWKSIAKIAKLFNVSADYLLGLSDVRSPAPDVQAICKYTGLSEDVVSALHSACSEAPFAEAINLLARSAIAALRIVDDNSKG